MLIEISEGECMDRLSILDIKMKEIQCPTKLAHVSKELESLSTFSILRETYSYYYMLLLDVNTKIWHTTNTIKNMTSGNPEFGGVAQTIFDLNQARFRLKNVINRLSSSTIQEQKSYDATYIEIEITDDSIIDLTKLSNLSLLYDTVVITCSDTMRKRFEEIVPPFNYRFT